MVRTGEMGDTYCNKPDDGDRATTKAGLSHDRKPLVLPGSTPACNRWYDKA